MTVSILPLALLGAGCGSKDTDGKKKKKGSDSAQAADTGKAGDGKKSEGGSGETKPAADSKPVDGKALGVTVWWVGAKWTLGNMAYDKANQTLTIDVEVENLLSATQTPGPALLLESDGAIISHGGLKEGKEIVAKSKVKNQIVFSYLENFDPAKTTMLFGEGDKEQPRVSLSGGTSVNHQPVSVGYSGDIALGSGTFTVQTSEVRWDGVPYSWEEPKKEKAYLVLVGKLKNSSTDHDIYFSHDKFSLTQPDGSKITADWSGPEDMAPKTKTIDNFYVIFTIDAKGGKYAGDYTLDANQDWGADNANVAASPIKLTVK